MEKVSILIIDDDVSSQAALRHVLDSEGWKVTIAPLAREALGRLASGEWRLVIANVAMVDIEGPLFQTLKELAQAPLAPGRLRVSVLFIVPELTAGDAKPVLEAEHLPYVVKPFHLHEFLERVSDLLLDAQAIAGPIRQVRRSSLMTERRRKERRTAQDRRRTTMFASREEYMMSEEEIAEYEKQEAEEKKKKEKAGETRDPGSGYKG